MLSIFFIASKLLNYLISPFAWILLAFLMGWIWRNTPKSRRMVRAGMIMLLVFSNPFLSNLAMRIWEPEQMKIEVLPKSDATVVVLGGMVRYYNSEVSRPAYGAGVDRLMQALTLYHQGKAKKVLICGGSGSLVYKDRTEADLLHQVILDAGVPDSLLLLDKSSRNTHENAIEAAKLIRSEAPDKPVILVTSAFHMYRSQACFEKQGITVIPYPVDAYSGDFVWYPDHWLLPSLDSIQKWDILFHEWFGLMTYKMMGYI